MENDFDNTDNWLKRKLQDTDPVWSEDAWNDLENRRNKKRRGIFWIYFVCTALILSIGTTILYNQFYYSTATLSQVKNNTQEVKQIPKTAATIPNNHPKTGKSTNPSPLVFNNSKATTNYSPKSLYNSLVKPIYTKADITPKNTLTMGETLFASNDDRKGGTEPPTNITNIEPENKISSVPRIDPTPEDQPKMQIPVAYPNLDTPRLAHKTPKSNNKKGSGKTYKKKTYIALEYNPSQIIFSSDISVATTNYISTFISKKPEMIYNNFGIIMGRNINKNLSVQTGINIYKYTGNLNYIEQTENTQLVAQPYSSFRMDTVMRRINLHTDTVYTTVTKVQNENRQTKVQLQYISIPLNVLYQFGYKSAQIGIGGGIVVHHLQQVSAGTDYNDAIKISPWKMNANMQFEAGWKLYKSVLIYTGYNIGYGVSNKNNYIQHGLRTGLKILF
ncbi:MAG: hypothetical protein SGJ10_12435 [Bacteroidota bacterium]|nr:hypothetical protein [Bacteroidota bacterium]